MNQACRAAMAITLSLVGISAAQADPVKAGAHITMLIAQPMCADQGKLQGYITAVMRNDQAAAQAFAGCATVPANTEYVVLDPGKLAQPDASVTIGKVKLVSSGTEGWTMILPED